MVLVKVRDRYLTELLSLSQYGIACLYLVCLHTCQADEASIRMYISGIPLKGFSAHVVIVYVLLDLIFLFMAWSTNSCPSVNTITITTAMLVALDLLMT